MELHAADSKPSTKHLLPYVACMAPNWYEVGAMLLEVKQEPQLKVIRDNSDHDVRKCCLAMLQFWMDTHPEATWHHLITALRSPGVNLVSVAAEIEKNVTVDHTQRKNDDNSATVNFADFENVADAFSALMKVFADELDGTKFESIRAICLLRASKRLQSEISKTTNVHSLFELLACNPFYFNWMKVEYLQTIAIASGNTKLRETMKCYSDIILSKTLGQIWNSVPSFHKTKTKYYNKVRAKFHGKDPDDIKVKDLKKFEPKLAKKIALHIMQIKKGSLTIIWCIAAEETYEAYLLALSIPQESREDHFLQIGWWVAYPPQFVIQELERVYDADLLTDKMCSIGLLTAHEQIVISSGHSVHQRNRLFLEHVRHMNVQALRIFCEAVHDIWPQTGLQLITALKYKDISTDESHAVTSEVKQDDVDTDTTSSVSQILFLHLIDQVHKLLQVYKLELVQQCESLNASDGHKISLFSPEQLTELSECNNLFMKLSSLFSWSNHSLLKALAGCSSEAVKLLDEFDSKLDSHQPITSYPMPCLSSNMIPTDTSTYTILAVRYDQELYQCTLQYVYDVQSVMIEKCDITQHCLQLLAVRSDPTILYWTIPKCVVDLINTNVPLHSEYLYSRRILEVLVYPDVMLTTGGDVCYGALAFKCNNQLFSEELETADATITDHRKDNTAVILKHVRSQCDSLRNELSHKINYANALEEALNLKKQGDDQEQTEEQTMITTEVTDERNDGDNLKDVLKTEPMKYELDKECALKVELSTTEEYTEELKKENAELKKMLTTKNKEFQITVNQLNEEINEKSINLKIQQLKEEELQREKDQLYKLVNKHRESKNANKISIGCQTEEDALKTEPMKYELDKECAELSTTEECTEELKKEIAELKKMLITTKNKLMEESQITVNQLNEEINEKSISLKMQQLKEEELQRENDQLRKLVNKYHDESKNANKISIGCQTEENKMEIVAEAEKMECAEKIEGHAVITEEEEKRIITEAMEENGITVTDADHKKLKYFTIKVEALFECHKCGRTWSSSMATVVIDLLECKANKSDCQQRCKICPEGWVPPKFTEDRFKEAIDRVIGKYWERKSQDNDNITPIDNDWYRGNPRAPHEESLCERCTTLGKPCW